MVTRALLQVSDFTHLITSKQMGRISLGRMYAARTIQEMVSRFRNRHTGLLIRGFLQSLINTKSWLTQRFRLRASINSQLSRWIEKRSYCRKINAIGHIRMHWLGIRRSSIDFQRDL